MPETRQLVNSVLLWLCGIVMGAFGGTWLGIWFGVVVFQGPLHKAIEDKADAKYEMRYTGSGWEACEAARNRRQSLWD